MPENNADETTLAGLWVGSKRSRKPSPAQISRTALPAVDPMDQLDLLFSPVAPSPKPFPVPLRPQSAPTRSESAPAPHVWSVRDLVAGIRQQVEQEYQDIWVEGEISNCRPAPSGHLYFTLKDGEAQLPVVLFRREAQLLRFRAQDGIAVLIRGRISVYDSRGQLQLIAQTVEPRGAGTLQLAFEQLKARLLAEGLFEAGRKRPLPTFPRCVGVVTSTGGAVLHDIIQVIHRRHARLNLLVYPAVVQGAGCADSIVAGIRWFNQRHLARRQAGPRIPKVDLILIARGGGSIEDLAGFNDEALARAIAASALPVVSAIGHETDFTIADFVADLRAPTPSAAAEMITAAQHRIEERVQALDSRVRRAIRYQLVLARQRFTALSFDQIHNRLQTLMGRRAQRLDDLGRRLEAGAERRLRSPAARLTSLTSRFERHNPSVRLALARRRAELAELALGGLAQAILAPRFARLNHAAARLHALSPVAVLSRGYALVYARDGSLLRSAADARPGEIVRARLAEGSLLARVEAVNAKLEPLDEVT
jgi:exodeoxyribonuclease VII large subunit